MKYITLSDLSKTVRDNIWKVPRDIDFIIGIPRSGMIAASLISSYLNVPLVDIDAFVNGVEPHGGLRLKYFKDKHKKTNKVLVIDDTVSNGTAMNKTKAKLSGVKGLEFVYLCVYLEGRGGDVIDIYLEDLRMYTENFTKYVLYEWNIFQHHGDVMRRSLYDIDGVLCLDPPDERNEKEYINYIKDATPLFIPMSKIGGIITYRLEKNREITKNWLEKNNVTYDELIMFDANTWEERYRSRVTPEMYKGLYYKNHDKYNLFVESDDRQAKMIAEISKKPVYCVETNKLYQ